MVALVTARVKLANSKFLGNSPSVFKVQLWLEYCRDFSHEFVLKREIELTWGRKFVSIVLFVGVADGLAVSTVPVGRILLPNLLLTKTPAIMTKITTITPATKYLLFSSMRR